MVNYNCGRWNVHYSCNDARIMGRTGHRNDSTVFRTDAVVNFDECGGCFGECAATVRVVPRKWGVRCFRFVRTDKSSRLVALLSHSQDKWTPDRLVYNHFPPWIKMLWRVINSEATRVQNWNVNFLTTYRPITAKRLRVEIKSQLRMFRCSG